MAKEFEYGVHYFPYDKTTVENMYNMRFDGRPISFLLLDRRKTDTNCHLCASFMTLLIPGSKRVEGNLAALSGGEHSWVEIDNYVYDTTRSAIWLKDAYYEKVGVLSTKIISEEEVHKETDKYLNDSGFVESYVAWIRELEENMESIIYSSAMTNHIERFKEEIGYSSLVIDERKVESVRNGINYLYAKIELFKRENATLVKSGN